MAIFQVNLGCSLDSQFPVIVIPTISMDKPNLFIPFFLKQEGGVAPPTGYFGLHPTH